MRAASAPPPPGWTARTWQGYGAPSAPTATSGPSRSAGGSRIEPVTSAVWVAPIGLKTMTGSPGGSPSVPIRPVSCAMPASATWTAICSAWSKRGRISTCTWSIAQPPLGFRTDLQVVIEDHRLAVERKGAEIRVCLEQIERLVEHLHQLDAEGLEGQVPLPVPVCVRDDDHVAASAAVAHLCSRASSGGSVPAAARSRRIAS